MTLFQLRIIAKKASISARCLNEHTFKSDKSSFYPAMQIFIFPSLLQYKEYINHCEPLIKDTTLLDKSCIKHQKAGSKLVLKFHFLCFSRDPSFLD